MDKKKIQKIVRESYGKIVQEQEGCGCGTCGPDTRKFAKSIGYSEDELRTVPDDTNLTLSCGNPTALASLKEGEVVLDLVLVLDLIVFWLQPRLVEMVKSSE